MTPIEWRCNHCGTPYFYITTTEDYYTTKNQGHNTQDHYTTENQEHISICGRDKYEIYRVAM